MYDNVDLSLSKAEARCIDFIDTVPYRLTNVSQHTFSNEVTVFTGYLDGLKVSVSDQAVKIKDNSLCKWYLGNNFETLARSDTQRAIEKISDLLSLPLQEANVFRIDLAQNFIMKNELPLYLNHLGTLQHYKRLEQDKGLYYQNKLRQLVFYDKCSEYRAKGLDIPALYKNRFVLRYELRFKSRLKSQFNLPQIKAITLYDNNFYHSISKKWFTEYQTIKKIRDTLSLDYKMITTKKQYQEQTVIYYVQARGGELQALQEIIQAQQQGLLTSKQAFDLKHLIKRACTNELFTKQSDFVSELDNKVKQAYRYNL